MIIIVIILTAVIIAGIWFLTKDKDITDDDIGSIDIFDSEEAKEIAEQWVKNESPTYVFDGYNLEFLEIEEFDKGKRHELTFAFTSRAPGYGDRAEEMTTQLITPHIIEVVIEKGKIIGAVTDGVYDEIKKTMIEPKTRVIIIYFIEMVEGEEHTTKAIREIPYAEEVSRVAIEELLKGPSVEERALGLSTLIPKGTKLLNIDIQGGVAKVNFSKELEKGFSGSSRVTTIRNQIEKTLMQFDTVDKVIIMIEGENKEIPRS